MRRARFDGCVANDVRIAELIPVRVIEGGNEGGIGIVEMDFQALILADRSPGRYDIGLFIALDRGSALEGDNCYSVFALAGISIPK